MCRFAAYLGPEIPLERIVVLPTHSLLQQSKNANEAKLAVNGDGFGIAWYGAPKHPGLYRDVLPAWSDGNLTDLCRMVSSRLFLAHVRASTVGETSRTNCHPFVHGHWSFMHNGQIGEFSKIRRRLEASLPDALYDARRGTTDSELFFLLMLANGLDDDPHAAVRAAINTVNAAHEASGVSHPVVRLTCAFSDGQAIYGFRYASDRKSPSLYVGENLDAGGRVIASEPLETDPDRWTAINDAAFVTLDADGFRSTPLLDALPEQPECLAEIA